MLLYVCSNWWSCQFIALLPYSPVYGYERVMAELEVFKPVLVDITQGKVESEFHRMYEGTRKEQNQLKVAPKAGPLCKWSASKVGHLNVVWCR